MSLIINYVICNLHIKETAISQKRSKGIKNWGLSTVVKLSIDWYNLRLRFGIFKLKFLRSNVGSRSVVSQLFG